VQSQSSPETTHRPVTAFPLSFKHLNMLSDVCFMMGYVFAVMVVVVIARKTSLGSMV
jgi:hypothetical protein